MNFLRYKAPLVAGLISFAMASCGGSTLPVRQVYSSSHCAVHTQGIELIGSENEIAKVTQKSFALSDAKEKYPYVDYDKVNVFAISLGSKPNSGYTLALASTEAQIIDGALTLALQSKTPDAGTSYTQVMVSPCIVVAVPKGRYTEVHAGDMKVSLP